jgi:hypothetical protein
MNSSEHHEAFVVDVLFHALNVQYAFLKQFISNECPSITCNLHLAEELGEFL